MSDTNIIRSIIVVCINNKTGLCYLQRYIRFKPRKSTTEHAREKRGNEAGLKLSHPGIHMKYLWITGNCQ